MFTTPKGFQWMCGDAACLADRDEWGGDPSEAPGADGDELVHCSTDNCHGAVWTEKGLACEPCGKWYCMPCWQTKGRFNREDVYIGPCCVGRNVLSSRDHTRAATLVEKMASKKAAPK